MTSTFGSMVSSGLLILLCCCSTPVGQALSTSVNNATPSASRPTGVAHGLEFAYAAKPLSGMYAVDKSGTQETASQVSPGSTEAVNFVSNAVTDSMVLCQNFVNTITAGQALQNTGFDIISIVTSALATVFVPVSTVRALSGASTISQGTKGVVNGDFFQTLTTQILAQKIKDIYYSKIDDYRDKTLSPPSKKINAATEFSKIVEIHSNCSIPAAVAALTTAPSYSPNLPTILTSVIPGAMYKLKDGTYVQIVKNKDNTFSAQPVDQSGKQIKSPNPPSSFSQADMLSWLNQMQAAAVTPKAAS